MENEKITVFPADEAHVRVCGRSLYENGIRYLSYTNSFIEFEFTGVSARAEITSDLTPPEDIFRGWVGVCINGETIPSKKFKLDAKEGVYELYRSDEPKTVKIRLMKLSEAAFAKMGIVKITLEGELLPPPKALSERRIEFVGDSITCGFGIDGVWNKDAFSTETENPIKGYAYKTALKCRAEFQYVSWSGMGVYSSWVADDAVKPLDSWLAHDIYLYTDSGLENTLGREGHENHTPWDFSKYVPHIILFNMGTNDQSWTKHIPERCGVFKERYYSFLKLLREKNPGSYIVCTYGVMGTDLVPEEKECVDRFRKELDGRIEYIELPVQLESDGIGAEWHPSEKTHDKMSELLSKRLNELFEEMGL